MSDKLTALMRESILVQAAISLIVITTLCMMYFRQITVPPEFLAISMLVIGFYFGQRSNARSDTVLSKAMILAQLSGKDTTP